MADVNRIDEENQAPDADQLDPGLVGDEEEGPAPEPTLHVVLVTGDRPMYDGPANRVVAIARRGQIAIGAHHAPMVAALEPGEVLVRLEEEEHYFAIGGGFCEVRDNELVILADTAERPEEIDLERARAGLTRANERIRQVRNRAGAPPEQTLAAQRAQARAKARIQVAGRLRQRRRRR